MKKLAIVAAIAAAPLALCPHLKAQPCMSWTNTDIRGVYSMSGSGWRDLSKINPAAPPGFLPGTFVGMVTLDGVGGGTGWLEANLAGTSVTAEFVKLTYQVKGDCTVLFSYFLKFQEFGITLGPESRLFVSMMGTPLEAHGVVVDSTPASPIDVCVVKRIWPRE